MLHTILSKRKVLLDHLRTGLETLSLVNEVVTRPLLFERLFVGGSEELNAEAVKASLFFPQSMSHEERETKQHLFHFLETCSKEGEEIMWSHELY